MARRVGGWDALRAWRFIRASKAYRAAWKKRMPQPGLPERGPFPVRLQTSVDLAAMAWGMLAWEDPYAALPLAPFWAQAGVIDGRVTRDTPPLVRLAAEGGATLSGSIVTWRQRFDGNRPAISQCGWRTVHELAPWQSSARATAAPMRSAAASVSLSPT